MKMLLFAFALLTISTLSSNCQTTSMIAKFETSAFEHTVDNKLYSISYPNDWTFEMSKDSDLTFLLYPTPTQKNDIIDKLMQLSFTDIVSGDSDIQSWSNTFEGLIKTNLNGNLIESKPLNYHGKDLHKFIYEYNQDKDKFKVEQFIWIKDEKSINLIIMCKKNDFEKFSQTAEKIMQTFKLK